MLVLAVVDWALLVVVWANVIWSGVQVDVRLVIVNLWRARRMMLVIVCQLGVSHMVNMVVGKVSVAMLSALALALAVTHRFG